MSNHDAISAGMPVFTAGGQALGQVDEVRGTDIVVNHQAIPRQAIARVGADGVYLVGGAGQWTIQADTMTGHSVEQTTMMEQRTASDIHLPVGGPETTVARETIGRGAGATSPDAEGEVAPGLSRQGDEAAEEGSDASRTVTGGQGNAPAHRLA